MIVIIILWILASVLYIWVIPYMQRSRDTKRVTSLFQYTSILEAYEKNFDTFPANYGSGWNAAVPWYCLSEIVTRDNIVVLGSAWKFSMFSWWDTTTQPTDPDNSRLVPWCNMWWSYLYSRVDYSPTRSQVAILAANLELRESANYGTGGDLIQSTPLTEETKYQQIINAKKWSVDISALDHLFIVTKIR